MIGMSSFNLPGLADQNFLNALADESAEFILVPTPALKELIASDELPAIKRIPQRYRVTMLNCPEGSGINLDRALVKRYVNGASSYDEKFILDRCDILCVSHTDVRINNKLIKV